MSARARVPATPSVDPERRRTEIERMRAALTTAPSLAEEEVAADLAAAEQRLVGERRAFDQRVEVQARPPARRTRRAQRSADHRVRRISSRLAAEGSAGEELRTQPDTLAIERLRRSRLRENSTPFEPTWTAASRRGKAMTERYAASTSEAVMASGGLREELRSLRQALSEANERGGTARPGD